MWRELRRRIGRILSANSGRQDSPVATDRPIRFMNPATVPESPVAGERTIRFTNPVTKPSAKVTDEKAIRFSSPLTERSAKVADEKTIRFSRRDLPYRQITDVPEYRFDDIRPEDIVIDIGANVGAFCIRAARYSDFVTAVEPVTSEILRENIRMNRAHVRVIEGALGDGGRGEVSWDGFRVSVPTYTLCQITAMACGCDFLKCDCEGAEWCINPEDLAGIRRIEMELHIPPIGGLPNQALLEYIGRNFDFEIERMPGQDVQGVMGILHAERRGR